MNRRDFMKTASFVVAGLSFGGLLKPLKAIGADAPPAGKPVCTTSNDPVATALGYVPVAKDIDKKKYPQFKKLAKDHNCAGCGLYTKANNTYGACTMIANCSVEAKGLCGSWQKRS